jgi:hypothetical protein
MIGASIDGTKHEQNKFTVESVWRKVQREFPDAVQAGPKVSIDDACAQWTTHNSLRQWFDDAKRDLIASGLVKDTEVYNNEGELVSELTFKKKTAQGGSSIWMKHILICQSLMERAGLSSGDLLQPCIPKRCHKICKVFQTCYRVVCHQFSRRE